jgi:transcriptional regulator with XRE-family HTH domain
MGWWQRTDSEVERQGTTYRWLAAKIKVPETTMSGWRRTGVLPRIDYALGIAKALKVPLESLADDEYQESDPWLQAHRQLIDDLKALTPDQLDTLATTAGVQAAKNRAASGDAHANGTGSA